MNDQALTELRANLVEATRRTFDLCRDKANGQTIYAYALVMCSINGEALQPWCHTEETFARKEAKSNMPKGEGSGLRRYHPDEWWALAAGPIPGGQRGDWWDDLSHGLALAYDHFGKEQPDITFELLVGTLKTLDDDGYFGRGEARKSITLMVCISDEGTSEGWWPESIRRLNPPTVVRRFQKAVSR